MQRVEIEIARLINEIDCYEVTRHFEMLGGGKRLRAEIILRVAENNEKAPLLAAIVELIHGASLLHDDVIDDAATRRGVLTVNATDGSKVAVLLGDVLYSKAFTELIGFDEEVIRSVVSSVTALSKGEMMDIKMTEEFNSDEDAYFDMLYLKSASLIEAAAFSSAHLAGKDSEKYGLFGKYLGLSYQIIDDILDITQDAKTLGKPVMKDFVDGKCTLPYIYLYKELDDTQKQRLVSLYAKSISKKDEGWIKEMMFKYKAIEKSFAYAKAFSNKAINCIKNDQALVEISEGIIKRGYL